MQRLIDIQQKLNAPKNQRNSFGGYNYRSAEDILEAVKPLLAENEVTLILTDEIQPFGEGAQSRYYIKATATLYASDGKEIAHTFAFAREADAKKGMDESQVTGTASSYARKYALNGLFCIDDAKDADTDEHHRQTATTTESAKPKTVPEYISLIHGAETAIKVNALFYQWSKLYPKGTAEYKQLSDESFNRKKELGA